VNGSETVLQVTLTLTASGRVSVGTIGLASDNALMVVGLLEHGKQAVLSQPKAAVETPGPRLTEALLNGR
jgi:hypothetical protein